MAENSEDRTSAAAINVAYQHLMRLGWRFDAKEIGKVAREIVDAMKAEGK